MKSMLVPRIRTLALTALGAVAIAASAGSQIGALECGASSDSEYAEFEIATGCDSLPVPAGRAALHGLGVLIAAQLGASCLDSGCTLQSCNTDVEYLEGDPTLDIYPSGTGYCADASYEGKVVVSCTACVPL